MLSASSSLQGCLSVSAAASEFKWGADAEKERERNPTGFFAEQTYVIIYVLFH